MTEETHEVKEGISDYNRNLTANQIKQILNNDPALAKIIYAWLRISGIKLTEY